jgi:ribosomal protein S18 acetylase RimI-like enzyme
MDCSHIYFCEEKSKVNLIALRDLFDLAAFWAKDRKIEDLEIAIAHSNPVITIWDNSLMIGFARATSDGIYRATIWDVMLHPHYRGLGLGRRLVETILNHPSINRVERVYLMTTHQQKFYEDRKSTRLNSSHVSE